MQNSAHLNFGRKDLMAPPIMQSENPSADEEKNQNTCNKSFAAFPFIPPKLKRMNGMSNIFEKVEKATEAVKTGASAGLRKYLCRDKQSKNKVETKLLLTQCN